LGRLYRLIICGYLCICLESKKWRPRVECTYLDQHRIHILHISHSFSNLNISYIKIISILGLVIVHIHVKTSTKEIQTKKFHLFCPPPPYTQPPPEFERIRPNLTDLRPSMTCFQQFSFIILIYSLYYAYCIKELSLCHKLWFSKLYIFVTQCCRP